MIRSQKYKMEEYLVKKNAEDWLSTEYSKLR